MLDDLMMSQSVDIERQTKKRNNDSVLDPVSKELSKGDREDVPECHYYDAIYRENQSHPFCDTLFVSEERKVEHSGQDEGDDC